MENEKKTTPTSEVKVKRHRQMVLLIVLLIVLVICLIGFIVALVITGKKTKNPANPGNSVASSMQESQTETEPEPVFEEFDINLMAVGDSLMHMGVIKSGLQDDGTRNYEYMFDGIKEYLEHADIKVINQETIFGGNDKEFSGYPLFNSPTEMGDAIAKVGFNVVLHASNHSNDMHLEGLLNCINFWETNHPDVTVLGIHSKKEDLNKIITMEVNGVTFALLNYTYSTNSDIVPKDTCEYLNMLCPWDENYNLDMDHLNEQVITDIKAADELADYVIVFPHWGEEYTLVERPIQDEMAKLMTEAGADLIIGTHPHVIEPIKWVEADNGNKALCYYSLGNYVSTQVRAETMLEGMAWVSLHVAEDGITINEDKTGALPLVNHYQNGRIVQIYALEDYNQDLASVHGINSKVALKYDDLVKWSKETFGDYELTKADIAAQFE